MLPQLEEERRPAPQPPSGGGQAGSDPVQGMGSLVVKPIQEQGRQPAQGDELKDSVPGTDKIRTTDANVHANWLSGP